MDDIKVKLASGEYQIVEKTLPRTKPDVWEKFVLIIVRSTAKVLTPNMCWTMQMHEAELTQFGYFIYIKKRS